MNWNDDCARCGKETVFQTGMVWNVKQRRHKTANWCSKECEKLGTGKNCPFPHSYKSKEYCRGSLK